MWKRYSRFKAIGCISATEANLDNSVGVPKLSGVPPVMLGADVASADGVLGAREPSMAGSVMSIPGVVPGLSTLLVSQPRSRAALAG